MSDPDRLVDGLALSLTHLLAHSLRSDLFELVVVLTLNALFRLDLLFLFVRLLLDCAALLRRRLGEADERACSERCLARRSSRAARARFLHAMPARSAQGRGRGGRERESDPMSDQEDMKRVLEVLRDAHVEMVESRVPERRE